MASGFIEADVSSTVTLSATQRGTGASGEFANLWGGHDGTNASSTDGVELTTHTTTGTSIGFPTGGVKWSHIEVVLRDSASANQLTHEVKIFLSWDAAGNDICAGPSSDGAFMVECRSTSGDFMISIGIDSVFSLPPDGTADKVYLWIATQDFSTATPALRRARLYWHDLNNKG